MKVYNNLRTEHNLNRHTTGQMEEILGWKKRLRSFGTLKL